jgi:hypothetical protein
MEIKVLKPFNNDLIGETKVIWRIAAQRDLRMLTMYFIFGLLMFLTGYSHSLHNNSSLWNFRTGAAFATVLPLLSLAVGLIVGKRKWISKAIICSNKYKGQMPSSYTFNDNLVTVREPDAYTEIKWSVLTGYKLHNGYIFIYGPSDSIAISLSKSLFSESEYSDLVSLVSSKLPQKINNGFI